MPSKKQDLKAKRNMLIKIVSNNKIDKNGFPNKLSEN